ncbi:hypothetical protein BGZ65_010634 [Modicella reniformis]|uniref:Uncharacterized protein n=1 Tax=Modicella reniformis TaxID=1440133 RepID=A0A9P6MDR8_9FUNG|nr:hypothetical protein BGZ65_010634 [Modicella reniformis]
MSNQTLRPFNPPPTDNQDHCNGVNGCENGNTCFLYSTGTLCQEFSGPLDYPATGIDAPVVDPPQWYLANSYPSVRYSGSLVNQTLGANCSTIPVPPNDLYRALVEHIVTYDMGKMFSDMDRTYSSTLVQYRGNCAEGFYCHPSVPVNTTDLLLKSKFIQVKGELPGTCQTLKYLDETCLSSSMCNAWHVPPKGYVNNDQYRCFETQERNADIPHGVCRKVGMSGSSTMFRQASWYLFTALVVILLLSVFMWYRRQKRRQLQLSLEFSGGNQPAEANSHRGGVYRPPGNKLKKQERAE